MYSTIGHQKKLSNNSVKKGDFMKNIKVGDKIELKKYVGKYEVTQVIEKGVWARGRCGVAFYTWDEIIMS